MFKSTISAIALFAATSTGVLACGVDRGLPSNDFITAASRYEPATSSTVPGVVVRVDGKSTHYELGDLGLTRAVVFDDCGDIAEAWAMTALGADVKALNSTLRGDD
jgi:hypothetical protein